MKMTYACDFKSILLIIYHIKTLFEDYTIEPPNKGQKPRSQGVLCSEVRLYPSRSQSTIVGGILKLTGKKVLSYLNTSA